MGGDCSSLLILLILLILSEILLWIRTYESLAQNGAILSRVHSMVRTFPHSINSLCGCGKIL